MQGLGNAANALADAASTLIAFNPLQAPRLRLFCFPYAGGDANVFRAWAASMPAGVEVIGVQYPGRGMQRPDAAIARCDRMVARLERDLLPLLDRDFVFFGHSNGALISYELARSLAPRHHRFQRHHFFSARVPAHLPTGRPKMSLLCEPDFIRELGNMGGTPPEVLADSRLMVQIAPRLRADFAIGEFYVFQPGRLLDCGITTMRGAEDHLVSAHAVQRWSELASGAAEHHVIPGNHFFVNSHRASVLDIVCGRLEKILQPSLGSKS